MAAQLSSVATVPVRSLLDVNGGTVEVPANGGRTHLQFRRFAGCTVCHLRLDSFGERYQEVADAGITEVVVLHSADGELRGQKSLLPLTVVADPDWLLYREFAMETGLRALADPRAWWATIRRENAMLLPRDNSDYASAESRASAKHFGLPADFLIEPDGTVIAAQYGRHADDQWSVDQLLKVHRSLGDEKAS